MNTGHPGDKFLVESVSLHYMRHYRPPNLTIHPTELALKRSLDSVYYSTEKLKICEIEILQIDGQGGVLLYTTLYKVSGAERLRS